MIGARVGIYAQQNSGLDPDALAFIAAHEAATGMTMGSVQRNCINGTYLLLKGGNSQGLDISTKIKRWFCYAPSVDSGVGAAQAAGFALDLMNNSAGSFTGFVGGDFTPSGLTGGNGKYLNMNYNPVTLGDSVGDFLLGWDATTASTDNVHPCGSIAPSSLNYTTASYLAGKLITTIGENPNLTRVTYPNNPAGLMTVSSTGTTKKVHNNGVEIDSNIRTTTAFANTNMCGHGAGYLGGVSVYVDVRTFRGFLIGTYLSTNEQTALAECWQYFQDNIITGGR